MFNNANKEQVLEMQAEFYANRIGTVYGDYKVVDVWYDWDKRKQMWRMECTKCGAVKVTADGREYAKSRVKGIHNCEAEKRKAEKFFEKQKRAENSPDNPKWVGQVFGPWRVLEYQLGKGWKVECVDCGRQTYHRPKSVRELTAPKCLCKFNYGKYSGEEWIGKRYGHLTIMGYSDKRFDCVCDCGRKVRAKPTHLFDGYQVACGNMNCIHHRSEITTHGLSNERIYRIWSGMRQRCYNPKSHAYFTYGGRGITICDEWRDDVHAFRNWALSHGYSDNLTIDRIDGDKGYSPDNCRWATAKEQANNQHPKYTFTPKPEKIKHKRRLFWTIDGETKAAVDWCEEYGVSFQLAAARIKKRGMTPKEALTMGKYAKLSRRGVPLDLEVE